MKRIELRLDAGILVALEGLARADGRSRKGYCEKVLIDHVNRAEGFPSPPMVSDDGGKTFVVVPWGEAEGKEEEVYDYTNPFWREEHGFEDSFKAIGLWKWGAWDGGVVMNVEGVVMYKEGIGAGSEVDLGSIKVKLSALKNKVILL